ncbi:MAG: NUDIX hydrolase, partial [Sulfurovum sp.]|nr:NUDIX hydrolase [Sulfurovaceae bacterium]
KQFRPAVYMNNNIGMSIELCAGIVDKDMSLKQIAQEEIDEECGYRVPLENIEKITSFFSSVGFAGSRQTIYYAKVNNSMKYSDGGGVDGEVIEVIELNTDEAETFIFQEDIVKTSGLLFSFMWWFKNKKS